MAATSALQHQRGLSGYEYELIGPAVAAPATITRCFDQGLLFKIVTEDQSAATYSTYFYNDSAEHEAVVTFQYSPASAITAQGPMVELTTAEPPEWSALRLVLFPGDTALLFTGEMEGYRSEYLLRPLSNQYKARVVTDGKSLTAAAIAAVEALGVTRDLAALVRACVEHDVPFVDLSFPPRTSSLCRPNDARQLHPLLWQRPRQLLGESRTPGTMKAALLPQHIEPGLLGDCWLLGAVAAVCETAALLDNLMRHPESERAEMLEHAVGAYRVLLVCNGWLEHVIVDDFLPCIGRRPCFARHKDDPAELSVSLIQKAFAKAHGSYSAITSGDVLHGFADLTSFPVSRLDERWQAAAAALAASVAPTAEAAVDDLFDDLARRHRERYRIILNAPRVDPAAYMATKPTPEAKALEAKYASIGLALGQSYTVIDLRPVDGGHRMLQLRNVVSGDRWRGDWSPQSPLWNANPRVREACASAKDDNTFWISFPDALRYFDGCGVGYNLFNGHNYRTTGKFEVPAAGTAHAGPTSDVVLEVRALKDFSAFLTISQPDLRAARSLGDRSASYAPVLLSVCAPVSGGDSGAQPMRYAVVANSTGDALRPSGAHAYGFESTRDVTLRFDFRKSDRPYFVVPRVYLPHGESPPSSDAPPVLPSFVLSMLSTVPMTETGWVCFRRVDPEHPMQMGFRHQGSDFALEVAVATSQAEALTATSPIAAAGRASGQQQQQLPKSIVVRDAAPRPVQHYDVRAGTLKTWDEAYGWTNDKYMGADAFSLSAASFSLSMAKRP